QADEAQPVDHGTAHHTAPAGAEEHRDAPEPRDVPLPLRGNTSGITWTTGCESVGFAFRRSTRGDSPSPLRG
ncbi:MAG TPA: hypothetical protein VL132_07000, partial [Planctomycetaceae bacterium]|nr:hypothetical protein [Planctomycetaceae bacterium]